MTNRTIKRTIIAPKINMGGIMLEQPLPYRSVDQIDPFLLVHHWALTHTGGRKQQDLGVGPHPHRGFAPVTFIFKGAVHHRDSRNNNSIVSAGGTQWMNSGMGIVHSERPTKEIAENGGAFEIIQFWVNIPAKHKMDIPSYQPLQALETPVYTTEDGHAQVAVVCGLFKGLEGKIKPYSPLLALRLELKAGAKLAVPIAKNFNAFIYQLDGSLTINSTETIGNKTLSWFNNDGTQVHLEAHAKSRAILLAGEPIAEEVTTYGPFVMNNQTEIMEAMRDYQMGKMGVLIEEFDVD